MKRFTILLTIVFTCLTLLATSAEARRFGGGSSIGKQRTMSAPTQRAPAAAPAPGTPAQPAVAPQPAGNRWLGPLAGLAIGAGLGAMFAGGGMGGMGGAMGSILMVMLAAAAVMFLISMFRRKQEPAMAYSGCGRSLWRFCTACATTVEQRCCGSRQHPGRFSGGELFAQCQDFVHPPAGRE